MLKDHDHALATMRVLLKRRGDAPAAVKAALLQVHDWTKQLLQPAASDAHLPVLLFLQVQICYTAFVILSCMQIAKLEEDVATAAAMITALEAKMVRITLLQILSMVCETQQGKALLSQAHHATCNICKCSAGGRYC